MRKHEILKLLDSKFCSPDEPEKDWYFHQETDGFAICNDGLGIIHMSSELVVDEDDMELRMEFQWSESESNLSRKAEKVFADAVDYLDGLGEIVCSVQVPVGKDY